MISVRPVRAGDAEQLAPTLREADVREIRAVTGEDPLSALRRAVSRSEPCYAVVNAADRAVALFGAAPDARRAGAGLVWLLASTELVEHPRTFLRQCRAWVAELHRRYPVLGNQVDARNATHLRWLQWCGFTIVRRLENYGVEQRPFFEFTRVRRTEAAEGGLVTRSAVPGAEGVRIG